MTGFWDPIWNFIRRARVPLVTALVVVVALISLPAARDWLAAQFQAHPLRGAVILGGFCFVAAFLVGKRGAAARELATEFRDAGLILAVVTSLLGFGLILTGAAPVLASVEVRPAALQASMLWAMAWFMAGFLAGFLFGVPKVVAESPTLPAKNAGNVPAPGPDTFLQRPNTNLEQISDWLTKIIVGITLVELRTVPAHLKNAARWVAESLSGTAAPSPAAVSFGGCLIVYFAIVGFLAGYLLTLLFLAGAFRRAGNEAYGGAAAFGEDDLSGKIRDFWKPSGGPVHPDNARRLTQWIKNSLPEGTSITDLINTKDLQLARRKLVDELGIK